MEFKLSDQGFENLVEIQIYLEQELGKSFTSEQVIEYLLQNAINYVNKEENSNQKDSKKAA